MLNPIRPTQLALEQRRGAVERSADVADETTKLNYFLTFHASGEAAVDVNFPVRFIDVPISGSSFHLEEGTVLEDGNFPWASCGAIFKSEIRAGRTFYTGATLIVVIGGTRRQKLTVHWTAEAKAIIGPVDS